jgi:hypothetical protein
MEESGKGFSGVLSLRVIENKGQTDLPLESRMKTELRTINNHPDRKVLNTLQNRISKLFFFRGKHSGKLLCACFTM